MCNDDSSIIKKIQRGQILNLLIIEYFSGGGYGNKQLSSSIVSESYAMLQSLISSSKAAGHKIITFLDSRLKTFNPPNKADKMIEISSPEELYARLRQLSSLVDAVYVIAPESNQTLQRLLEIVFISGGTSLNCELEAIKAVSNKMTNYQRLKKVGLKVPQTVLLNINEKPEKIKQLFTDLGCPLVFKPIDGISCDGLSIVKNKFEIREAVKKIAKKVTSKHFIVQNLIRGKAASSCVFSNGYKATALTLNRQLVTLASPHEKSGYYGGIIPFDHALKNQALRAAERAVEAVKGLKGYLGVDMTLTEEDVFIMEVNPRLTSSYIGFSKIADFNPAEAIVDAGIKGKLPKNFHQKRYAFFSKVEVPGYPKILPETYKLKDVIAPPFPIEKNKPSFALVASSGSSSRDAQLAFYRTKRRLLSLYGDN